MSASPSPPGRRLLKYRVVIPVASSSKMTGPLSANGEFTTHPRFSGNSHPKSTGGPQGASVLARCETQMSAPPRPPGRTPGGGGEGEEVMYRLRPSLEIAGLLSLYGELTTGPRFIGAPHGPYCGCSPAASAANFVEAEGP